MSVNTFFSSELFAFLRLKWPFFIIALLSLLLINSWTRSPEQSTPPPRVAPAENTVNTPTALPEHTAAPVWSRPDVTAKIIAPAQMQDTQAPQYRPFTPTEQQLSQQTASTGVQYRRLETNIPPAVTASPKPTAPYSNPPAYQSTYSNDGMTTLPAPYWQPDLSRPPSVVGIPVLPHPEPPVNVWQTPPPVRTP